jgi:hypothetical protein
MRAAASPASLRDSAYAIPHLAAVGHSTRKIIDGSAVRNAQRKVARKSVATVNKLRGVPVEECK